MSGQGTKKTKVSRRDLIKGMAVGAVGFTGMSMLGACTSSTTPSSDEQTEGSGSAVDTTTPATQGSADTGERVKGYCGPGDWLGTPPVIDDADIVETITTDVVVVGGGHSGTLAALGAVDSGSTVSVIETQPWSAFVTTDGSNAGGWYGSEIANVNSKFFIDKGVGPYNTGEICYEFVKRSLGRCNPDVIKAYVQNSGAMFDRMVEVYEGSEERRKQEDSAVTIDVDIYTGEESVRDYSNMLEYPCFNNHSQLDKNTVYPIVNGDYKTWNCDAQFYGYQSNNIEYFNKYIVYYCQENGATWHFEHTATVLTQNDNGDITGVIVEDLNTGTYKKFVAESGVVLAAGDFIGNPEMCWALLNEGMELAERAGTVTEEWGTTGTRNGRGHRMACWVGAMIEPSPRGWMVNKGTPSGPWGTHPLLQLNSEGKRFYNEAGMTVGFPIVWRQAPGIACCISDANIKESLYLGGLEHGSANFGHEALNERFFNSLDDFMANCVGDPEGGEVFDSGISNYSLNTVYAAETLDQLADFLEYEGEAKQNFLDSVAHYNELCNSADGDTDYGKEMKFMRPIVTPPFVGARSKLNNNPAPRNVTLAGLIADDKMRVSKDGNITTPIKGLYTCGNCLGGRYGPAYNTPISGNSIGMATTHGWLAGKNAAAGI